MTESSGVHFLDEAISAFIFLEFHWTIKYSSVSWYNEFLGKSLTVKYDSNDYSFSIEIFDIHEFCKYFVS